MKLKLTISLAIFLFFTKNIFAEGALPSEYIMQFLKDSTTLYTGSSDWKNDTNSKIINTIFARTYLQTYAGMAARAYYMSQMYSGLHLIEEGASGQFEITRHDDGQTVEIRSKIIDMSVVKPKDQDDVERLKKMATQLNGRREKQSDYCTQCTYMFHSSFNEKARQFETTMMSECISRMPAAMFNEKVNS